MECKDLVQKEGLFSINEELDDISTESLKVNTEMKHSIPAAISFFECYLIDCASIYHWIICWERYCSWRMVIGVPQELQTTEKGNSLF